MSEQKQNIYEFGDFQLDIGKGILSRENQPINLQSKTFETLCFLVKSNGQLITPDELMNALWADTFVEENNLRQHIGALRKALGEKEKQPTFIETVPRRGYRFLPKVRIVASTEKIVHPPNNLPAQFAELIGREFESSNQISIGRIISRFFSANLENFYFCGLTVGTVVGFC